MTFSGNFLGSTDLFRLFATFSQCTNHYAMTFTFVSCYWMHFNVFLQEFAISLMLISVKGIGWTIGRLTESGQCAASQVPSGQQGLPDPSGKHYLCLGEQGVFWRCWPTERSELPLLFVQPSCCSRTIMTCHAKWCERVNLIPSHFCGWELFALPWSLIHYNT